MVNAGGLDSILANYLTIVQSGHLSHALLPVFRFLYDAHMAFVAASLYTYWPPILSTHKPCGCNLALTREPMRTKRAGRVVEKCMMAEVMIIRNDKGRCGIMVSELERNEKLDAF